MELPAISTNTNGHSPQSPGQSANAAARPAYGFALVPARAGASVTFQSTGAKVSSISPDGLADITGGIAPPID